MIWFLLFGCSDDGQFVSIFDGPIHSDILYPSDGSMFREPIAFVSNTRNGRIIPLDLKHETVLSDQYSSPFLRPRGVSTGANRQLAQVVSFAQKGRTVTVFAVDKYHQQLIEVPYITGMFGDKGRQGEPVVVMPETSDPIMDDKDNSGNSFDLTDLQAHVGYATTEEWKATYNGETWTVKGSRSGIQENEAETDVEYNSDLKEVSFTITGNASSGDEITFQVDTGLIEYDLPGSPTFLYKLPYGNDNPYNSMMIVGAYEPDEEQGYLYIKDREAVDSTWQQEIVLPQGLQPWRMTFGPEDEIFLADANNPRIFSLSLDQAPADWQEIPTPEIVRDLAYVESEDYSHLFVASASNGRIDILDLENNLWKDINPYDQDSAGLPWTSPFVGLSVSRQPIPLQTQTAWGARHQDKVVIATTFGGEVLMLEGKTGCLTTMKSGPTVAQATTSGLEPVAFADAGPTSNPSLYQDPFTKTKVTTNYCGGILRNEEWTVRYDELGGDWIVKGSITGEQQNRALQNERYISDSGELSFTIIDGLLPPSDGDTFVFTTASNVLRVSELVNSRGASEGMQLPGQPVVFDYLAGPTGGGWDPYNRRSFALVPVTNSNIVFRLRLDAWSVGAVWH